VVVVGLGCVVDCRLGSVVVVVVAVVVVVRCRLGCVVVVVVIVAGTGVVVVVEIRTQAK